jgi:hypothetical protein
MFKPEGFDPSAFVEKTDIDGAWGDLPEDHLDEKDPDLNILDEVEDEDDYKMAA